MPPPTYYYYNTNLFNLSTKTNISQPSFPVLCLHFLEQGRRGFDQESIPIHLTFETNSICKEFSIIRSTLNEKAILLQTTFIFYTDRKKNINGFKKSFTLYFNAFKTINSISFPTPISPLPRELNLYGFFEGGIR
jgi:hypothetical protein